MNFNKTTKLEAKRGNMHEGRCMNNKYHKLGQVAGTPCNDTYDPLRKGKRGQLHTSCSCIISTILIRIGSFCLYLYDRCTAPNPSLESPLFLFLLHVEEGTGTLSLLFSNRTPLPRASPHLITSIVTSNPNCSLHRDLLLSHFVIPLIQCARLAVIYSLTSLKCCPIPLDRLLRLNRARSRLSAGVGPNLLSFRAKPL
jgi:hypothetical protein